MTTESADSLQGVTALIGITFGLIPLAKLWFGADPDSIWTRLLGAMPDTALYALAGGVVCLAIVVIALLERRRSAPRRG